MPRKLPGATIAEKVALNSVPDGDCLRWTGAKNPKGYGRMWFQGRTHQLHRLVYESVFGKLDASMDVDHVHARGCRFRDCVNIEHLEPVTHAENIARMNEILWAKCTKGHPKTGDNQLIRGGSRVCRRCFNDRRNRRRAELRAERIQADGE